MSQVLDTETPKKKRSWRMPGQLMQTIAIIFVWRMIPICLLMLLTVNPWGYSYYHWGVSLAQFLWAKIPALTPDEQFRLGAFELAAIVSVLTLVTLFNPRTTWLKLTLGQFVALRLMPLALIGVAGYFWIWPQLFIWKARLYDTAAWEMGAMQRVGIAAFVLVGLLALAWWIYVLRKCWHELGASKPAVALALAVLAAMVYLMHEMHVLPSTPKNVIGLVEVLFGLGVGFCFSIALLDRRLSWTFATSTVITDSAEERSAPDPVHEEETHEIGHSGENR